MDHTKTARDYGTVAKLLHWSIVVLLIAQFSVAWTMPDISRGTVPTGLIGWHLSIGTTILAVAFLRLAWRLSHPAPGAPPALSRALQLLSRATHYGLYALLLILPLMGWMNASARGWPVRLFGMVSLPALVTKGSTLGMQMGDLHATTALILLAVVALHVAGALYHALVLRDRTLQRMI